MLNNSLAVTCCYFNPCGYKKKHSNFIKFYKSLSKQVSRIQVVELVYGKSQPELPKEVNAMIVRSEGVLWHKENLLNLGIDILLCEGYKYIAWLDADVLFLDPSWAFDASICLENYNLCQLFASSESFNHGGEKFYRSGCVRYWLESGNILPIEESYSMGYGWAARSDVLSECGLYENSIMGGGDSLMWLASFSESHNIHKLMQNHPIYKFDLLEYYLDFIKWSEVWGKLISSNISCTFNPIISLSHGNFKNRRYAERYKPLLELNYNPTLDLYHNDLGVLQSQNRKMYETTLSYLHSRNEDELSWLQRFLKT